MTTADSQDVHASDSLIASEPVKPEYGTGATYYQKGDTQLDKTRIATLFTTILENAQTFRRQRENEIIKAYAQYFGETADASKAEWQSRINIPKANKAVDTTAARITNAIFQTEDWFDILPYVKTDDEKVDRAKKMTKWQLDKSKARGPITEAIKNALICGVGPMKVHFTTETREEDVVAFVAREPLKMLGMEFGRGAQRKFVRRKKATKKLKLEAVMPLDYWADPSGQGRFGIQRVRKNLSDLWALTKPQTDPATGAVVMPAIYDGEEVAKVLPGTKDTYADMQAAALRRELTQTVPNMQVDVYEFWGDFIDPSNGVVLYHNIVATFVDKRFCIRMPQANPYHHCQKPFIVFKSVLLPSQVYPYGILYEGIPIQDGLNRAWNIIMDKTQLQVPTVEVFPMAARNPSELMPDRLKWAPGKTWTRKSAERAIFYPVEGFAPASDQDFMVVDRLSLYHDIATGVPEIATGQEQTTNRKTKEEIQVRSSAADMIFNDTAVFIESDALSPMLEMVYSLMVQFEDQYDDAQLLRMFGEKPMQQQILQGLKAMSPEERWEAMQLDGEFRVVGITNKITQQDRMNRLMNFMRVIQADPTTSVLIDKFEMLRMWRLLLDLPKELVLDQTEAILQTLQQAQLAMIAGQAQGQAQGPGGKPPGDALAEGGNPHNNATAAQADAGYAAENPEAGPRPQ